MCRLLAGLSTDSVNAAGAKNRNFSSLKAQLFS